MKKILLINPPKIQRGDVSRNHYFPLSLLFLGSVLKRDGFDVKLTDVNLYFEKRGHYDENHLIEYIRSSVFNIVSDFRPDIIGIGCLFSGMFKPLISIATIIKEEFKNIPIVVGGIHPTIFVREILLKYRCVDYVVIGEGEESFLNLVKCISNKRSVREIDGLAYRESNEVVINPKTMFIHDLDSLPFVNYDLVDVKSYQSPTEEWYSPKGFPIGQLFPVITSRSCPYSCSFCSMYRVHGKKFRVRNPDNVLDELEHLYDDYGARYFEFVDDNITLDRKRAVEIFRGMEKRGLDVQFDTPNGVNINSLNEEVIGSMVDAGMTRISLALESGSDFIRNKIIGKNLSLDKIREVFDICSKHTSLFIEVFIVIGIPQETKETLEDTYKLIQELAIDGLGVFFATPYPGTQLFDYCIKNKLLPYKAEDYMDVVDLHYNSDRPHFEPHQLSADDLIAFKKKCDDLIGKKRAASDLPKGYPLRYKSLVDKD